MNNSKSIKRMTKNIIILCILVMVILAVIFTTIIIRKNKEKQYAQDEFWQANEGIDYDNITTEETYSYEVANCIQTYIDYLNINNSAYFGRTANNTYEKVVDEKTIKQNIYNLLSQKAINENNITVDNVYNYTGQLSERLLFVPIKMNVLIGENADKYLAYGFLIDQDYYYKKKDIYIFVNKDTIGQTFSIELVKGEYNDINQIKIENENKGIEQNDNNVYNISLKNENFYAEEYYNTFKRIMLADTKLAYEYLNEEYRNKRFGNYEEFEKYVKENREELRNTGITKYQVSDDGIYSGYVCLDAKDNYYIFKENDTRRFEVFLDTFTIEAEKFTKAYNSGNISKKVQMNIDKFIQMINAKDYKNSYALLYDQFKTNYFPTEDSYKQYIKSNLFEYNKVTYDKFSNEGETYIYDLIISDKTESTNMTKKLTIIMKLKEGTDFVMSFSIE